MKIAVYNFKGGQGKTVISLNLALTLGYGVVTNDVVAPIQKILATEDFVKLDRDSVFPQFPADLDLIFDLGGYIDDRGVSALHQADWVLVPVLNEMVDIQVAINSINEFKKHNKNIVVLANKLVKGDFEEIKEVVDNFFDLPVLPIKKSKALPNIFVDKKSVRDMVAEGGLKRYHYEEVSKQFDDLISFITTKN